MKRVLITAAVAMSLFVAACSAPAATDEPAATTTPSAPSDPEATTSSSVVSDDAEEPNTDSSSSTTVDERPLPEGPAAADFTLALGQDRATEFVLSQETKPVFMVFWAEW
ncbi:MAG: hypothetical protein ACR2N2_05320 [Acidimicrobiia bacterium]